jgi:Ca2+-binding EF-hand superfamily protein
MKPSLPFTLGLALLIAPAAFTGPVTCPQCGNSFQAPGPQRLGVGPEDGREARGPMPERLIERLDSDGDGQLTLSELPDDPRAQRLAEADTDGDDTLSLDEIQIFLEANRPNRLGPEGEAGDRPPRREQMLERLDADGNGTIEVSELPDHPRAQPLAEADTDGDGVLSEDELGAFHEQRVAERGDRPRGERQRGEQRGQRRGSAGPPIPEF